MSALSKGGRIYVLQLLAFAVFSGLIAWGASKIATQRDLALNAPRSGSWVVFQAQLEHVRFLDALDDYVHGSPTVSHDELLLRFDILWSRIPLLVTGAEAEILRRHVDAMPLHDDLVAALLWAEPLVADLTPGDMEEYGRIRGRFDPFASRLHSLGLFVDEYFLTGEYVEEVNDAFFVVMYAFLAATGVGVLVIIMLIVQTRRALRSERAYAAAAEEALRAHDLLGDAVEVLADAFILFDGDDRLVLCNARYREINAGIADLLIPGARFEDLLHAYVERGLADNVGEPREQWMERRRRGHREGLDGYEERQIDEGWFRISSRPTAEGGSVSVRTDITELKRVEWALRESEARLTDFVDATADWVWETDADDRFAYVSDNIIHVRGLPPEWYYGKRRSEIHAGINNPATWAAHEADLAARRPFRDFVYRTNLNERGWRWLKVSGKPFFDADGKFLGYRGAGSDVTDQILAETARRVSEERFDAFMRHSPLATYIKDEDGRLVYANPKFLSDFDLEGREWKGKLDTELLARTWAQDWFWADREALRRDQTASSQETTESGGTHRQWQVHRFIIGDDTGNRFVCGMAIEVTKQLEIERQLRQSQKMDAIGQLTGGVAHDFNNILAVIRGNAQLLADKPGQDDALTNAIVSATDRGAELTYRLLAFSRLQSLHPRPTDLARLTEHMKELLRRTLGETLEIVIRSSDDLRPAMADPGQLENALLNLALNARDAMPRGGRLTILCVNATLDEAYAARNPDAEAGEYVMLAVSDEGVGIPPEVQPHVFEPFFTTKDVGRGTGLGLSMVYGFARQSGGHVSIDSELGRGTTVSLYLPTAQEAPQDRDVRHDSHVPMGRGEMVLVVEDDPEVRLLTVRLLETTGYRVIDVPNAASALEVLADAHSVDIVLSDVVLPDGASGPEFARQAQASDPRLKVIFMSGYTADAATHDGLISPESVLLNKPFRRSELANALRDALDGGDRPH